MKAYIGFNIVLAIYYVYFNEKIYQSYRSNRQKINYKKLEAKYVFNLYYCI